MLEKKLLDPILAKHGLILVENRYLKGRDYEDGTVSFEAVIDSIFLHNSTREEILTEIGKMLNPPKKLQKKAKKAPRKMQEAGRGMNVDRTFRVNRAERSDGKLRGEG
jgi:hypothetical protein